MKKFKESGLMETLNESVTLADTLENTSLKVLREIQEVNSKVVELMDLACEVDDLTWKGFMRKRVLAEEYRNTYSDIQELAESIECGLELQANTLTNLLLKTRGP